jgi:hypothetical protein
MGIHPEEDRLLRSFYGVRKVLVVDKPRSGSLLRGNFARVAYDATRGSGDWIMAGQEPQLNIDSPIAE